MTQIGEEPIINMTVATVELSEIQAALFVQFQKNYEKFSIFQRAGLFDMKDGEAKIQFDSDSTIKSIDFNIAGYRKGKKVLHIISVGV